MAGTNRRTVPLYTMTSRFIAAALLLGLLNACATAPQSPAPAETSAASTPASTQKEEEPGPPERAFPDDSLYSLLVAEFAIRRQSYDIALEQYTELAPELRDIGISAHTARLGQYMQRQREALEAARLWVELAPDDVEANSTLATLLVRQGRAAEALPYMAAVQREGVEARFPTVLSGFASLSEDEKAQLVDGINALSEEFPDNTQVLLAQALVHMELQQYDLALDKLDHLLRLSPNEQPAMVMEAEILLNQQARKPFARIEKTLRKDPQNTTLRLRYARMLTAVDLDAAREQFEILSTQTPEDADLLFSLGLINREVGDYAEASAYLQDVIKLDKRVGEAYYYLGRIEEDRDQPLDGIPYYQAIPDGREFLPANNRIAEILVEKGQLDRLADIFAEQRVRYPDLSGSLYGLQADALNSGGYQEQALALMDTALAEAPLDSGLLYARAMILEKTGDLGSMERDLRAILSREPDNSTALNALGYTLANRTERYDEALDLITRALQLEPNEPAILDSMGWILYRVGRNDEAIEYLTRAYANFPDPEVAAHLGEVLWVTGQNESAIAIWQGAYMLDPEHPVLTETLERLGIDLPAPASNDK